MALDQLTEVLQADIARFPRARLTVTKGPDKGLEVVLEGQPVVVGSDESCQLKLTDSSVSRRHFELTGGPGGYRLRDLRSTNGVRIEGVQVMDAKLSDKVRLTVGRTELRFEPERHEIQWPLSPHERFGEVLGRSLVMRRLFAVLERAAPTESPVILEGGPGTGKELLAHAIHEKSARREGPFVVVDLGASSEPLMESDLFGHDVSTSRPNARPGAFEEAEGGTLYLDEVSELSNALQARVLRALETKEIKRPGVGGVAKVDVRVVASTQKDLEAEVKAGRFREDLFFRLRVIELHVPPLRERTEDILPLARQALVRAATREKLPLKELSAEASRAVLAHPWPGNVRELINAMERAIVLAPGKRIELADLPPDIARPLKPSRAHAENRTLAEIEREAILSTLAAERGSRARTAERLGIGQATLFRKLKQYQADGHRIAPAA